MSLRKPALWLVILLAAAGSACSSVDERRRQTLERASRAMDMGDSQRALSVLDSFLGYDPRDLDVIARKAEILLEIDRPRTALQVLESIPGDVALDRRSRNLLARALVGSKRNTRATRLLTRMKPEEIDQHTLQTLIERLAQSGPPRSVELPDLWLPRLAEEQLDERRYFAAAETVRRMDDPAERDRWFDRVIRQALDADEIRLLRELDEVDRPPVTAWKLLARHRVLNDRGLGEEAAEVEREFLDRFPEHPRRYEISLSLARRENRGGRFEQALALARAAAALRPAEVEPLVEQALALDALGDADQARRILEMALTSAPGHGGARSLLARLDGRLDREETPGAGSTRIRLSIDAEGRS